MAWHNIIKQDKTKIIDFVNYFDSELQKARTELKIHGLIEKSESEMPGIVEMRFRQLQEIEAVLEMLNNELKQVRATKFKKFLEAYHKSLSSSDAWKYTDGEKDVCDLADLINEVAFIRNQYIGITKALEQKSFMLGHLTRLRTAGLEDAYIG